MDRRRLARLLQRLGKVPAGATDRESGNMIFDAAATLTLIEVFQSAVSFHDLSGYLGASKRQVETLYRADVPEPIIPAARRRSGAIQSAPLLMRRRVGGGVDMGQS
ncbi:hypothetical protein U879_18865 [Defluviimonas sp. 20V17]|nr:hypothetical protein U879_18865 [Defluviimonas sp. 20V17]SDX13444.1 hypothetical protein SAMN05444006_110108 [Allgaiera indica]